MLAKPFDNSVAALYIDGRLSSAGVPDHELLLAVNSEDDVGGLRYLSEDGTYFADGGRSRYDHVAYYYAAMSASSRETQGWRSSNFGRYSKELLTSGKRPGSVRWRRQSEVVQQG